ncbi:MAG: adenosylmethionine--8-amino-7-oxononanoate transaminase [Flavobacteriales bacterium]
MNALHSKNTLAERDKKHLWHPLTQHKLQNEHLAIVKAKDCSLWDEQGVEYIDGIASWYTCMYGHCNPYIIQKVTAQLQSLDHVVFAGFTHRPAIEMSEKLMQILPKNQNKLFFSDNGSTSVDVAIKMALQYYHNRGKKRTIIVCLEDAFHGDTFGAMSVSGLSVYNGAFEENVPIETLVIPVPSEKNIEQIKKSLVQSIDNECIAGFIYEPLVQGAAAMRMYAADALDELISFFQNQNVLCIADEVMTGFGKTGKLFASDYLKNQPDIICLSKALTGGLVPMGLTSCTASVFDAFYDDKIEKGFFHGHTYSANPTACTAVSASIDLLMSDEIQAQMTMINQTHKQFENQIKSHTLVESTRVLGVIFALDLSLNLDRYGEKRQWMFQKLMQQGVFLRPLGKTIYILPPFVITHLELHKIYHAIRVVLDELKQKNAL